MYKLINKKTSKFFKKGIEKNQKAHVFALGPRSYVKDKKIVVRGVKTSQLDFKEKNLSIELTKEKFF